MPNEPTITDALDLLDHDRLGEQVRTVEQALEWAAAFFKAADATRRKAVELRGQTAARIWDDEEFAIALAEIAEPYEVSEQRAHQIIKEAKAADRKEQ